MSDSANSLTSSSSPTSSSSSSSTSSSRPDTASIAASVIADIEGGGESQVAPVKQHVEAQTETQTETDPDDFESYPAERVDSLQRKRENAIPHSRVKTMLTKREQKVIGEVAKALGISKAEAELKLDDVLGGITERSGKLTEYESQMRNFAAIEEIMAADGDRYIRMLAQVNPQLYGKFAALLDQAPQQTPQRQPVVDDDPEPEPDYPIDPNNPNGPKTYSLEGLRKLRAWDRRQAKKDSLAEVEGRLTPIEQERKAAADRAKLEADAQAELAAKEARVDALLRRAVKWPGFEEHNAEILAALKKNGSADYGLEEAYAEVMHEKREKLATEHTKVREEVVTEMNSRPRSTSLSMSPVKTQDASSKPKSTRDHAAEIIRQFES